MGIETPIELGGTGMPFTASIIVIGKKDFLIFHQRGTGQSGSCCQCHM